MRAGPLLPPMLPTASTLPACAAAAALWLRWPAAALRLRWPAAAPFEVLPAPHGRSACTLLGGLGDAGGPLCITALKSNVCTA